MRYTILNLHYGETEEQYRKCLDSIKAQTFKDFEVLCIDHASISGLPVEQIVNEYGFKYLRLEENHMLGYAHNFGFREAKGEYICIVDSDDYIEPDYLEQIDKVNQGQDIIFVAVKAIGSWEFEFIPDSFLLSKNNYFALFFRCMRKQFLVDNEIWELEDMVYSDYDFSMKCEKLLSSFGLTDKLIYNYSTGHAGQGTMRVISGELKSDIEEVARLHEEWSEAWLKRK